MTLSRGMYPGVAREDFLGRGLLMPGVLTHDLAPRLFWRRGDAPPVKIFWNDKANQGGTKARYWTQQHYRRQKQNWNYYSP